MGCGCDKRAKKMLEVAEAHNVKMPKKVRSFLARKAKTATRDEMVKRAARLRQQEKTA